MEHRSQQTNVTTDRSTCRSKIFSELGLLLVFFIFLSFALALAVIFNRGEHNLPPPRSFNQKKLPRSFVTKYPFIGALVSQNPNLFLCPVVIIESSYVLTTAACLMTNFRDLIVRVGSNFGGEIHEIDSIIVNDKFNYSNLENNIALVKLKKEIILNKNTQLVNKIRKFKEKEEGLVVGWLKGKNEMMEMVEQNVFIWQNTECEKYFNVNNLICGEMFNTSECFCDVTGPLLQNEELIGFWSWGISCLGQPYAFTNLIHHANWIYGRNYSLP